MRERVAIVGGGIIGLMTAQLLLRRGVRVFIADANLPARAASWAGGGIISPLYPWFYPEAVTALAAGAPQAHAELAHDLLRETGIDPQYSACGLLMIDPQQREQALAWCRRHNRRVVVCGPEAAARWQGGIATDFSLALWFEDVGNVRNPRLLQALLAYVAAHPLAECAWRAQVDLCAEDGDAVLRVSGRRIDADAIVVAAGSWSAALLQPFGIELPVVPVRGQMILFSQAPGLLRRIVLRDGRYLIPRRDGRIVAGSTLEYTGFDASVTGDARAQLLDSAVRILPALRNVPIEKQWAGLRPGSPSGIPFIDRVPGTRLFVNAGHFRNGLVLAPAAAGLGVAMLLGEKMRLDASPYSFRAPRPGNYV